SDRAVIARTLAGTKWSYEPPPRNVGMSTTVLFAASIEVTRATTTSSGSPSGKSSFGIRTAAGMSAKRSSTLCRPIARSISSSSEGMRLALSRRLHLRVWPGQSRMRQREPVHRFRWDTVALEIADKPKAPLQRLVLRLWDAGVIGGPLLEARSLPNPESERIREQSRTFNAPTQGTREDDGRTFRGPRPCQVRNLRLAERGERGAIEIRRVDGSDDLPVPNEDESPTHRSQPPEATVTTRIRSPSARDSSTGIGRSGR